jgi:RNA polymerase sigma factor (sigma-70 family)
MIDSEIKERFLNILEKNIGIIIKISRVYAKIEQDREDLVNDITLELWKSFRNFNGNSKISTWIYRVALNTSMNFKRKKKNDTLFSSIHDFKTETFEWLDEYENTEKSELLYRCIDELNELNKAIVLLYLDGNSHDDISEITGISKTNVGTRIGRIKEQIRNFAIQKI